MEGRPSVCASASAATGGIVNKALTSYGTSKGLLTFRYLRVRPITHSNGSFNGEALHCLLLTPTVRFTTL